MPNIKVEIASPEQIESLKELTKQLVEYLGQTFDSKRFDWGIRRRIYDPLQRHGILVAMDQDNHDEIIGMIIAELRIDPFGTSEGSIKQLFLKSQYRGKGVGRELLQKALEHLKKINVQKVKVNVREDAKEAATLYKNFNFKKVYDVLELDLEVSDEPNKKIKGLKK